MMFASEPGALLAVAVFCVARVTYAYHPASEVNLPQLRVAVEHLVGASVDADEGIGADQGPNIEKIVGRLEEFFQSLSNETESEIEEIIVNPHDTKGDIKEKLNAKIQSINRESKVHEAYLHYTALLALRDFGTVQARVKLVLLGLPELAVQFEDIIADDAEKFYDECVELKRLGTTLLKSDRIKGASVDIFKTIDRYIPCEKYASILYRFVAFQKLPFPGDLPWGPGPVIPRPRGSTPDFFPHASTRHPYTRRFIDTIPIGPTPDPRLLGLSAELTEH